MNVTVSVLYFILITSLGIYFLPGEPAYGTEPAFKIGSRTFYKQRYVNLHDIAKYYGMTLSVNGKDVLLKSDNRELKLKINSRKSWMNDVKTDLGFSPVESGGKVYVSEKDLKLLIDPLFRDKALKKHAVKTIVIDAGHGGKDPGAITKRSKEKEIALKVSLMLEKILKDEG